jgi:hypothetical protein
MKNVHLITKHIYITSDEEIKDVRPHKGKWQLEKGQILNKFPNYLTDLSECKLVILTTDPDLIAEGVQAIDDEFLEWFVKNPNCEKVEVKKGKMRLNCDGEEIGFPDMSLYKIIIPQEEPTEEAKQRAENYMSLKGALEPKQETLEEAAEREYKFEEDSTMPDDREHQEFLRIFKKGAKSDAAKDYWYAKWHEERMYSKFDLDAEITKLNTPHRYDNVKHKYNYSESDIVNLFEKWFEQSKKK